MPHPRRSRQFRSARARAFRAKDVSLPRLRYVAEGRTLLLVQTRAILDLEREERVERAAVGHARTKDAFDASVWAWRAPTPTHDTCIAQFVAAEAELKDAKRSLARPAAIPVTLAVVSPPGPRCWPNALPGGTSRRRAAAAKHGGVAGEWRVFSGPCDELKMKHATARHIASPCFQSALEASRMRTGI